MTLTDNLFPDQDLAEIGQWSYPDADTMVWESNDGQVQWLSTACYDPATHLYIGRVPDLRTEDDGIFSHEKAVDFGRRLGQRTVWLAVKYLHGSNNPQQASNAGDTSA